MQVGLWASVKALEPFQLSRLRADQERKVGNYVGRSISISVSRSISRSRSRSTLISIYLSIYTYRYIYIYIYIHMCICFIFILYPLHAYPSTERIRSIESVLSTRLSPTPPPNAGTPQRLQGLAASSGFWSQSPRYSWELRCSSFLALLWQSQIARLLLGTASVASFRLRFGLNFLRSCFRASQQSLDESPELIRSPDALFGTYRGRLRLNRRVVSKELSGGRWLLGVLADSRLSCFRPLASTDPHMRSPCINRIPKNRQHVSSHRFVRRGGLDL